MADLSALISAVIQLSSLMLCVFAAESSSYSYTGLDSLAPSPTPLETELELKADEPLPIASVFAFPDQTWEPSSDSEHGFGTGLLNLGGGLKVKQVWNFTSPICAILEGGPDDLGATFFEPFTENYTSLGHYAQPNNEPLFGWTLVGMNDPEANALQPPLDYQLSWTTNATEIRKSGDCYIWSPVCSLEYTAVGYVVTNSSDKPTADKISCVRKNLTGQCKNQDRIWGHARANFTIWNTSPSTITTLDMSVPVGAFSAMAENGSSISPPPIPCLVNLNNQSFSYMPNHTEIDELLKIYGPLIYSHPDEVYLPSSVDWFFANGALLYQANETDTVRVEEDGLNLPQNLSDNAEFWLSLPMNKTAADIVKRGDPATAVAYLHVKPLYGATFVDIAVWLFFPFNGPGRLYIPPVRKEWDLDQIGEHVGDWEHVTLRISNFDGTLLEVYFSQHNKGQWVSPPSLEFFNDTNRVVVYSSLHGHASYPSPGRNLLGKGWIKIRNDAAPSDRVLDVAANYSIMAFDHLDSLPIRPWVLYDALWGPMIDYNIKKKLMHAAEGLGMKAVKQAMERFCASLPREVFAESGPLGPRVKSSWSGDEL